MKPLALRTARDVLAGTLGDAGEVKDDPARLGIRA
jgi:hypothetical protein